MIPEEEILQNIQSMDYVTCTPLKIKPSYYKLNDDSQAIVCALISINHLLPLADDPTKLEMNLSRQVNVFVPKENRKSESSAPVTLSEIQSAIIERDVSYETLAENFSEYDLSNGVIVSLKTVAGQISRSKFYTPQGEPIYTVATTPIIKIKNK